MQEQQKRNMINELKKIYKDVRFDFKEEEFSLQLLHDSLDLRDDDAFLDNICDVAIKYLDNDEQIIFAILYDYYKKIRDFKFGRDFVYSDDSCYSTCDIEKKWNRYTIAKDAESESTTEEIAA